MTTQSRGIDLQKKYKDVVRIYYAGFGRSLARQGVDAEELLQEVFRGLLSRNSGASAYDPAKSSFGHYVHMVISCVLSNYLRKTKRDNRYSNSYHSSDPNHDPLDDLPAPYDSLDNDNAAENAEDRVELSQDFIQYLPMCPLGTGREADLACKVVPLLVQGLSRQEIGERLGLSTSILSRVLSYVDRAAQMWRGVTSARNYDADNERSDIDSGLFDLFGF